MQLATSTVTDLASTTYTVLNGTRPLILLIFGVSIAFYIMKQIISLLPKG